MADRPESTVKDEPQVQPQATQARESLKGGNTPAPKVQDAGDATTKDQQKSGLTDTLAKPEVPTSSPESAGKHLPAFEVYDGKSATSRPKKPTTPHSCNLRWLSVTPKSVMDSCACFIALLTVSK